MIDFEFSTEQLALRDLARELFTKESPPSRLRAVWDGAIPDDRPWRAMAAAGLLGLTIPEEHGGSGGDEVDLVLVLEEAGRAALPDPVVETVAVGAPLLAEEGTDELRAGWLPRIAAGDAPVAVRLGGPFVADADRAQLLLLVDDTGWRAVEGGAYGVRPVAVEDRARRLFAVDVPEGASTPGGVEAAWRRGVVATSAVLNGVSMALLDMTLEHVKTRHQFGRPVGAFQAVKHKLADVHLAVEGARPAAWYAAYALARELPDADPAASVAKAAANDAAAVANREALQCHGGIGFTWEHDLHLWLKRGLALQALYGTSRLHRERLAFHLLDADA